MIQCEVLLRINIPLTNDQIYNMVKLYDILRDMDFELNDHQIETFDTIQHYEVYHNGN